MTTTTYNVQGMTCSHCVSAVTSELRAIPEVQDIDVDLASGAVTVQSTALLDRAAVATAIEEAGYVLSE